jgi:hypothetical protein
MVAQVNELEARKRLLLIQSEGYRHSIDGEIRNIKAATAWVPKTIQVARTVYPAFLVAAPLLGYFFGRKRRASPPNGEFAPRRRGLIAGALAGYKFFRSVKPVWDGFRSRNG